MFKDQKKERWRAIPNTERLYFVSDWGRVWSSRQGKVMRPAVNNKGYARVVLADPFGAKKTLTVHVLVLTAFVSDRPDGLVARHLNGVKTDNRLINLEWSTSRANSLDIKWHEGRTSEKLTVQQVSVAKRYLLLGASQSAVARMFGVTKQLIGKINRGQAHADVLPMDDPSRVDRDLTLH